MATQSGLTTIELTDDAYTVEQSLIRSKYKAVDADGNVVLRAKKKRFSIGDKFPFVDADGEEVFTVSSEFNLDRKRDYVLEDAATGEEVVLLDSQFSLFSQKWSLREPENQEIIATVETQNKLVAFARGRLGIFGKLFPTKFDIESPDGRVIGTIEGRLSLNDVYDVEIDPDYEGPREAVLAAAMVIDALEGN